MKLLSNKFTRSVVALGCLITSFVNLHAKESMNPSGFFIQRGTNLSHWLSQHNGWPDRETFITEYDIKYIASLGFDHVRLPIDEQEMWHEDGSPNEASFTYLDNAIKWSLKQNLRVVVDLHIIRTHHFNADNDGTTNTLWDDPAAQDHFLELWKELSSRLSKFPVNMVAYEPMNEPVAPDHEDWNNLILRAHEVIREREPGRVLIFGSNLWQIPETIGALKVPQGDKNIILSTHTYAPFVFTHYTASWTPLKDYRGGVHYPGLPINEKEYNRLMVFEGGRLKDLVGDCNEEWNKDRLVKKFEPAIKRARELGLQLYCGEYGCLPTVPRRDRIEYYKDITDAMEGNDMAWANWEYKGDFGIYEWHASDHSSGAPDLEMIDALVGD